MNSDRVELDPPVAGDDGVASAEWTVPTNFEAGSHTVVFEAGDDAYSGSFTVTAASAGNPPETDTDGDTGTQSGTGGGAQNNAAVEASPKGSLAHTGAGGLESSLLLAGAAIMIGAAGLMLARKRSLTETQSSAE